MGHLTIVALLLGCTAAVNRPPDSICDGHPIGYFVRDVRQCNAYLRCNQPGTPPTWGTCITAGSVFNEEQQRCVWPQQMTCFACPADRRFAQVAVPNRCDHFVQCIDDQPQQFECSAGLHFDAVRGTCNQPELAGCSAPAVNISCPAVDDPYNRTWWRDSTDCSRYAVCVNGQAERGACAFGLGFNMRTQQCDFWEYAECDEATGPPQPPLPPFSCAAQEPLPRPIYPHPTDCTRYFLCDSDNTAFPRECPPDTRFDIVQQVCDSPDRAVCAPGARVSALWERQLPAEPHLNGTLV